MTVLVAAGVVWRSDRILLTRRPPGVHLAGVWEFPGGKIQPEEDPRTTVSRECQEECGIDVDVGGILEVTFHRYEKKSVLLLFYRCDWVRGEVLHRGVTDHAWVFPSDLLRYELPPADRPLVEKLMRAAR